MKWVASDKVPFRSIAIGVTAVSFVLLMPALRAYGSVPISFIKGTSETDGKPTTSILITQEDVKATNGLTISSISDVHTQADLIDYSTYLMREDSQISSVTFGEHSISMSYHSSVYVLRMGERLLDRNITITDEGVISITKPWYASVLGTNSLTKDDNSGFSDISLENDSSGLTPESQARLLTRMQGRFEIGAM